MPMQEWYWFFWFLTAFANGTVSGFMACYGLFLGRFLRSAGVAGSREVFQQYRAFRQRALGWGMYVLSGFVLLQIIAGALFFALVWFRGGSIFFPVMAGAAGVLWFLIYIVSGFRRQERRVLKGIDMPSPEDARLFLERNVQMHIVFGIISFAGFVAALIIPLL